MPQRRSGRVVPPDVQYGVGAGLERTPIIADMQKTADMLGILHLLRDVQPQIRRHCPPWCAKHLREALARLGDVASCRLDTGEEKS